MEKVQILDKEFTKFIDRVEIERVVDRIANKINKDYKDEEVTILVTLNGALLFAADLLKKLNVKCTISCIKLSSYNGTESGDVRELIGLNEDLRGKKVLLIEDIIDTGNTYKRLMEIMIGMGVKDVRIATLFYKPDVYKHSMPVHYVGKTISREFIVGYGLDYDGYGRNLPDVYQLK